MSESSWPSRGSAGSTSARSLATRRAGRAGDHRIGHAVGEVIRLGPRPQIGEGEDGQRVDLRGVGPSGRPPRAPPRRPPRPRADRRRSPASSAACGMAPGRSYRARPRAPPVPRWRAGSARRPPSSGTVARSAAIRVAHARAGRASAPGELSELTSTAVEPLNGRAPVSSSNSTTPSPQMSPRAWGRRRAVARGPYGQGPATSRGASAPSIVRVVSPAIAVVSRRAMPKSSTLIVPSAVTTTLAGLRSQCTTPRWCACARAKAICAP